MENRVARAEKIEEWDIKDIRPYWKNPRLITREAVETVKNSIESFGYAQPIAVDKDGVIIAGHTRWMALKELGYERAQVIVLDLPPEKVKALRLIDNKSHELSGWDTEKLWQELAEVTTAVPEVADAFPEFDLGTDTLEEALSGVTNDVGGGVDELEEETFDGDDDEQDQQNGEADPYSVDMNDIRRAEEKIEGLSRTEPNPNMVEVTCPHCGEVFAVDVDRMVKILKSRE